MSLDALINGGNGPKEIPPCNPECKVLFNAGIPRELKWVKLADTLRKIGEDQELSDGQKRSIQNILLNTIKKKNFTEDVHKSITRELDRIVHRHCKDKEDMLVKSMDGLVGMVSMLDKRISDLVSEKDGGMGNIAQTAQDLADQLESGNGKENGGAIGLVNQLKSKLDKNIEKAMKMKADLTEKAYFDPLTKVHTRGSFDNRLMELAAEYKKNPLEPVSLIFCDVDHFKKFNDTYGHKVGDAVLAAVASDIRSHTRGTDMVARYGGEELVVLLHGMTFEQTMKRAEQIRKGIADHEFVLRGSDQKLSITISAGVACTRDEWADLPEKVIADSLVEVADKGVYMAKDSGRNQVCSGHEN